MGSKRKMAKIIASVVWDVAKKPTFKNMRNLVNFLALVHGQIKISRCAKRGHVSLFYRDRTICTRCHTTISYAKDAAGVSE